MRSARRDGVHVRIKCAGVRLIGGHREWLDGDQRGPTYRRTVGVAVDIGAYELDTDHIFGNTLETH